MSFLKRIETFQDRKENIKRKQKIKMAIERKTAIDTRKGLKEVAKELPLDTDIKKNPFEDRLTEYLTDTNFYSIAYKEAKNNYIKYLSDTFYIYSKALFNAFISSVLFKTICLKAYKNLKIKIDDETINDFVAGSLSRSADPDFRITCRRLFAVFNKLPDIKPELDLLYKYGLEGSITYYLANVNRMPELIKYFIILLLFISQKYYEALKEDKLVLTNEFVYFFEVLLSNVANKNLIREKSIEGAEGKSYCNVFPSPLFLWNSEYNGYIGAEEVIQSIWDCLDESIDETHSSMYYYLGNIEEALTINNEKEVIKHIRRGADNLRRSIGRAINAATSFSNAYREYLVNFHTTDKDLILLFSYLPNGINYDLEKTDININSITIDGVKYKENDMYRKLVKDKCKVNIEYTFKGLKNNIPVYTYGITELTDIIDSVKKVPEKDFRQDTPEGELAMNFINCYNFYGEAYLETIKQVVISKIYGLTYAWMLYLGKIFDEGELSKALRYIDVIRHFFSLYNENNVPKFSTQIITITTDKSDNEIRAIMDKILEKLGLKRKKEEEIKEEEIEEEELPNEEGIGAPVNKDKSSKDILLKMPWKVLVKSSKGEKWDEIKCPVCHKAVFRWRKEEHINEHSIEKLNNFFKIRR